MSSPLTHLVKLNRAKFTCDGDVLRTVYCSELMRSSSESPISLDNFICEKAPFFYRNPDKIINDINLGYFGSSIADTLRRMPKSESFRESHFGEILATIFAEEVMGLRRIYSKLSLLTSENSNAYKMDLVLYDPTRDPIDIVFGEVKSSPKISLNGEPVGHAASCFPSLFASVNKYSEDDSKYDLTTARDNINNLPVEDKERVRKALEPYSGAKIRVAGITVIDSTTTHDSELRVLASRRNSTPFDVDVIGVETFKDMADSVYIKLENLRNAACFQ